MGTLRASWRQIVSSRWTLRSFDRDVLTERLSSLYQTSRRSGIFSSTLISFSFQFVLSDISRLHTSRMSLAEDVDLEEYIAAKDDLSGADIKAVCTEAGLLALRERRMRVTKADFTTAREKVLSFLQQCKCVILIVFVCRCCTGRMRVHRKDCTCSCHVSFVITYFLILH